MKSIALANEKAIIKASISRLSKKYQAMKSAHGAYVQSVIDMGKQLLEEKEIVPHGKWDEVVNLCSEHRFGSEHASRIMRVAKEKTLVLEFFSDDTSIRQLNDHIAHATPEQIERAKQIEAERIAAEEQAKADRAAKAAELEAKKASQENIIEGDFKEVKQAEPVKTGFVQIEAEKLEEMEDGLYELASLNKSISKDNESMLKVFDADEQLSAAVKEIKRLNDLNTAMEGQLNAYMNERNALIKEAKYWRSRFEKLEKANAQ